MQVALALSLASVASPSFADAYDAAMAHAIAAKEKALDANDPSAWQEALRLFVEADALRATKDSKYELAFAASRLKEDDLAVEAYEASIALGLSGKAKDKADNTDPWSFDRRIQPLLRQYCYDCHNDEKAKGDVNLRRDENPKLIANNRKVWATALQVVHDGDMPAEDATSLLNGPQLPTSAMDQSGIDALLASFD